jgi:hypothetical protein
VNGTAHAQISTAAVCLLLLCVPALAQVQPALPLPPVAADSSKQCDAYAARWQERTSEVSKQHSACLASPACKRQGSSGKCSCRQCLPLHSLMDELSSGPSAARHRAQLEQCRAQAQAHEQSQAHQRALDAKAARDSARRQVEEAALAEQLTNLHKCGQLDCRSTLERLGIHDPKVVFDEYEHGALKAASLPRQQVEPPSEPEQEASADGREEAAQRIESARAAVFERAQSELAETLAKRPEFAVPALAAGWQQARDLIIGEEMVKAMGTAMLGDKGRQGFQSEFNKYLDRVDTLFKDYYDNASNGTISPEQRKAYAERIGQSIERAEHIADMWLGEKLERPGKAGAVRARRVLEQIDREIDAGRLPVLRCQPQDAMADLFPDPGAPDPARCAQIPRIPR